MDPAWGAVGRVDNRSTTFLLSSSLFLFLVQDLKGLGYEKGKPVGLVGVTELSDAQKKQLKEQQEVRSQAGDSALPKTKGHISVSV